MAVILNGMTIKAFRGIEDLNLENLSTINVLVGPNNAGKTSVLEAIKLISAPYYAFMVGQIAVSRTPMNKEIRKSSMIECVSSLFHKSKFEEATNYSIDLEATIQNHLYSYIGHGTMGEQVSPSGVVEDAFSVSTAIADTNKNANTVLEYFFIRGEDGIFSKENIPVYEPSHSLFKSTLFVFGMNYYRTVVLRLSASIIYDKKESLLSLLQSFEPAIEDISTANDNIFLSTAETGTLPLFAYGTGTQKALMLAAVLISTQGGVILIDEIDNAMNISVFREVFPWFVNACREYHVQAFVTTHSLEAIDAILDCQETSGEDDIRIITLRKTPKTHKTIAKIRTGDTARSDREKFEMELRI